MTPQPGQRLPLPAHAELWVRLGGPQAGRNAVAAIDRLGAAIGLEDMGGGEWLLRSAEGLGEPFDLVAYVIDDRQGGFVNQACPVDVRIGAEAYRFPDPDGQLAALILAEIYVKDGVRRLKVSNEGYAFGIDAYVRARNLTGVRIPHRNAPRGGGFGPGAPDEDIAPPGGGQPLASGSGVIVAPNLIVTNAHVIEGGRSFALGRTRVGLTPVAVDPGHDLALLQGQANGPPLPLRIAAPIWLGESVMASGYPLMDVLGSDLKVTTGNISGLTGSRGDIARFQFTAPIGSGSSGGAVIDEFGNLIGITAASLAHDNFRERGSISENVNFAVRVALVYELIAAAGMSAPEPVLATDGNRRQVVERMRGSVVSIVVSG